MYLRRIVEIAERQQVVSGLRHPYAEALLSALPVPDPEVERHRNRILLEGDVPLAAQSTVGMSLPDQLPVRDGPVRHRGTAVHELRPRP